MGDGHRIRIAPSASVTSGQDIRNFRWARGRLPWNQLRLRPAWRCYDWAQNRRRARHPTERWFVVRRVSISCQSERCLKWRRVCKCLKILAPQAGFEPATLRLTAGCSTIELLRNVDCPAPLNGAARTPLSPPSISERYTIFQSGAVLRLRAGSPQRGAGQRGGSRLFAPADAAPTSGWTARESTRILTAPLVDASCSKTRRRILVSASR